MYLCVGVCDVDFFFFKQKTAYEMRISDWSSDVCSSDLTPHLSGTPDGWDPSVLEPLLDRLAGFKPDAIAIEALTGVGIHAMWAYRESHPDVARTYGGRALVLAGISRTTLAMDMPQVEAEVRRTLAAWPTAPTPAQRRRLAALFVAAGDPNSALVQWWRLAPVDRIADASISAPLARELDIYTTRRNENHLIAVRLAEIGRASCRDRVCQYV